MRPKISWLMLLALTLVLGVGAGCKKDDIRATKLIIKTGMSAQHISAAAEADTLPVATNDTKEGRAQNRRIEIALLADRDELPDLSALEDMQRSCRSQ